MKEQCIDELQNPEKGFDLVWDATIYRFTTRDLMHKEDSERLRTFIP